MGNGSKGLKTSPTAVQAEGEEQETPLKKSPFLSVPDGVSGDCVVQVVPSQRSASSPESVLPTAVQAEAEVHETAPRKYPGLCEVGDGWRLQVVPFHCSATVPSALNEVSRMLPTAMHAVADVHETPVRKLFGTPAGAGIVWTLQLVPFHRSAMTCAALLLPTAVHADGEVQETAFKNDPGLPEVGVDWMLHDVPSHRSVTVPTELPKLSKATPTAMQAEGDEHDTALRLAPAVVGIGWSCQVVPSHRSATVEVTPMVGPVYPTAMHEALDVQLTPFSCVSADPTGLGTG
jgi:hypothetical protein